MEGARHSQRPNCDSKGQPTRSRTQRPGYRGTPVRGLPGDVLGGGVQRLRCRRPHLVGRRTCTSVPSSRRYLRRSTQGRSHGLSGRTTEVGHNHGRQQGAAKRVIRPRGSVFDTPKPTRLIRRMSLATTPNDDDLVLDFFAGSGTTGTRSLQQNAEDGGEPPVQSPCQLPGADRIQATTHASPTSREHASLRRSRTWMRRRASASYTASQSNFRDDTASDQLSYSTSASPHCDEARPADWKRSPRRYS